MHSGSAEHPLALSEVSRIRLPDPVTTALLFARGERLSTVTERGAHLLIDTSNGTVAMSLDASRERVWALEADGPLVVVRRGAPPAATVELWNVLTTTNVATLLSESEGRTYSAPMIGAAGFAVIRYQRAVGGPRDRILLRFGRMGRARPEIAIESGGHEIIGGPDAPMMFWEPAYRDVVSVDFETGARTALDTDASEPTRPHGMTCTWTRDASRTHLARFAHGPRRGCVWDDHTGARVPGPWTGRDLRHLFFAGAVLCAVGLDSTFTTYAVTGEELARGGLRTAEAPRPRPAIVHDRHVATITPDARGISVWDVLRGVEVARRETIEGVADVTVLGGRGGRIAVGDGTTLVCFDLGASGS